MTDKKMEEDKHSEIIKAAEKKAEDIQYGVLVIEFKVHRGKFSSGEVISRREKLG